MGIISVCATFVLKLKFIVLVKSFSNAGFGRISKKYKYFFLTPPNLSHSFKGI